MLPDASNFAIEGGKFTEIHSENVDNSSKMEYNIYILSNNTLGVDAQRLGQPMHEEKWKELTVSIEHLIAKKNGHYIRVDTRSENPHPVDISPRYQPSDHASDEANQQQPLAELEPPNAITKRLIIYTGVDIAKKKLKSSAEVRSTTKTKTAEAPHFLNQDCFHPYAYGTIAPGRTVAHYRMEGMAYLSCVTIGLISFLLTLTHPDPFVPAF
jgi:hypothetical protein